jgi:predicted deacylase
VVFTLDSGQPGPCVLVVGGIHGNEPSGAQAARLLAEGSRPKRGVLRVLPEANPEALSDQQRSSASGDLNRAFPAETPRAASIYALAQTADLVLDLHEAGAAWAEADVPTLVMTPGAASLAMQLLEHLNQRPPRFTFTGGAPAGSLVGALGAADRQALVVEVPARLPLQQRLALHRRVVEAALRLLDMR